MTLTITRITAAGDGMAEDAGPFPRTLPGEEVDLVDGTARLVTPSPTRVKPPCRHFKSCGGCAMQHADDGFVADWKTSVIATGLAARGIETDIRPILTSPPQSRRRAALHGKRTKSGAMVGFHGRASDVLIETPDCQLLDPAIAAALPVLEELTVIAASRKAELELVVSLSENGIDLDMRNCKPLDPRVIGEVSALAEKHRFARIAWDGEVIGLRAPPIQAFGHALVSPPPGAFLQATLHGQNMLMQAVAEAVGGAKYVADLFAGCGTFSLPAAETAEVWALEGEASLIAALDQGWRQATGLKKVTADTRDLFRRPVLPSELSKTDAVIIDPPRAGAEAQTIELAKSEVPRIAAVSCNPVTFARDADILIKGGYRLDWVLPVDQFRWSSHVELAAQFTRAHMA
ncbi:class I SAM-dependent RNA methyltransferase [uncultured Litoreibacter sp.]|uniref:class I SAM-dependent RNA methyltransferase n=1 Tax=uncultured Litoreibacter sp. TaxID=1392394 RepID=UPI00260E2EE7|nr:class I SAM-dependent RNA methyltransferase [uncultured Litoreibacter sp.]